MTTVGRSLVMPYGVWGRMPERTVEDALRSLKKHIAEVLDELGGAFLTKLDEDGNALKTSPSWEVRLWDEEGAFRHPFARVSLVGPDTSVGPAIYADVTQAMTVHLYPYPYPDSERAILGALRLRTLIADALRWGAARGRALAVPLWDHGAAPDLYKDTEARQPSDFFRVVDLNTEHMVDPEDDREVSVICNLRARWRRVPPTVPGHLVDSVTVTAQAI